MGYFDIQVNGYGGADFNQDDLSAEALHQACVKLRADGVDGILATIITEVPDKMQARLRRLVVLREQDPLVREVITGLHIEGPFLNASDGYRGAHPADAIRPAEVTLCERLLEAGGGLVRIFTLAPEQDAACQVIGLLAQRGIVAAAGHTDASFDQLRRAIDAGLSMMTHLGNGCPQFLPRHDNIVQRALALREHLWLSFIADGVHVPFCALGNYLDLVGSSGRALVTSDAMAAAGLGPGTYGVGRWTVLVKDDLAARAPDGSHLIGSAISMQRAAENLQSQVGRTLEAAELLTMVNPRRAIGLA